MLLLKIVLYSLVYAVIYNLTNEKFKLFLYSTLTFWIILKSLKFNLNLPPGPWGVPFLGYLPFMKHEPPHLFYLKMSEKYGDVFSIKMGSNLIVCIGTTKLMKDFFSRTDSTGRPRTPLNSLMGGLGIIISDGNLWKRQRQFLHEKFRALGIKLWSNSPFEKKIMAEIEELLAKLDSTTGQAVTPSKLFGRHIHNVICQLMMSFRFEENDPAFTLFNERVSRGMKLFGLVHIGEHVKAYLKLPGKKVVVDEIKRNLADISKFHGDKIIQRARRRSSSAKCSKPADLLDHYLDKIDEAKRSQMDDENKNNIFPGVEPEKQVVQVMNDLFSAGMETSLSAILWTLVMMMREPAVAATVRSELRGVVALGEMITMEHRLLLPYIEAVIFEAIRLLSIVPLGTTHTNATEWKIGSYVIPPNTHIIPLINKMNMDPEIYPDPETFKPERFIKNGKFQVTDSFMQFGVGQRMCIGNLLARMELFLIFANLMNNFEFCMPEGKEIPGLEGVLGITHAPVPFDLVFTRLEN